MSQSHYDPYDGGGHASSRSNPSMNIPPSRRPTYGSNPPGGSAYGPSSTGAPAYGRPPSNSSYAPYQDMAGIEVCGRLRLDQEISRNVLAGVIAHEVRYMT